MVRVVHMNIFYRMDFKMYDPKNELWRETESLRRWGNSKICVDDQHLTLEGVFEDKMYLTHILRYSAIILAQFPYKIISF